MLCLHKTEWMHVGLTKRVVLTLQLVKQKEPKLNTISQAPLAHVATRPTRPDFERKAGSD